MAKPNGVYVDGLWERINQEIFDQHRTKVSLAEQCGFDRKVLAGYDNKGTNIHLVYFARLCKALNVSADYLLFGETNKEVSA